MKEKKVTDYHEYVIKDGKFIGKFEEMYQNVEDPWHHGDAAAMQYDLVLYLIDRYKICSAGGKILDIGCGKGAFTARLKKQLPQSQILATDISQTAIKKAETVYSKLNIDFEVMDIQKEYKNINENFDMIIMSQIMWYILPDFKKIVEHMFNILDDDGYLLINQAFYNPDVQKYGKEFVSSIEDMLKLVGHKFADIIVIGSRLEDHNAIILFNKKRQ